MDRLLCSKVTKAVELIFSVLSNYKNPVVCSSFGKDSMVMLDILKKNWPDKLPIVFYKEPFFPAKYEFANSVILEQGYTVYDYPPTATSIVKGNGLIEIMNYYQHGLFLGERTRYASIPTGVATPIYVEDQNAFKCGLNDIYRKPVGSFEFPFDLCFVGHKSSDVDPLRGPVPLSVDVKFSPGGADYAFPLRHFTDEDIWIYTEQYDVRYNEKRYDKSNGYREFSDLTYNNDYFPACTSCMDRDNSTTVYCPKLRATIPNISKELKYEELITPDYIGEK